MSPTAIALILVAAVAHATWNLFSKQASVAGATAFIWLVAVTGSVLYVPAVIAVLIAARPHLTAANWAFMAGTGVLQSAYFRFLQGGYRIGDLSLVYPVGRGTGALLAALAGVVLLGERPGPAGVAGIALIVIGVVVLSVPAGNRAAAGLTRSAQPRPVAMAIVFATVTGIFIASYTVWDKYAVTTLHTPSLLQGYAAFPVMAVVFAPVVLRDRPRVAGVWRSFRRQVVGAGILAPAAYILVLIALSFTAVSAVAPAREVSVLFGVLLGRSLLGERSLVRRLCGAAAIVAGIIAIAAS